MEYINQKSTMSQTGEDIEETEEETEARLQKEEDRVNNLI